jgi:hypothetical protein
MAKTEPSPTPMTKTSTWVSSNMSHSQLRVQDYVNVNLKTQR